MKTSTNVEEATAAELALKAHVLLSDPQMLAEARKAMKRIAKLVNLTEAPEDAVCSLVIDLLQYCAREEIDWKGDVMSRARQRFRNQQHAAQKQ